MGFFENLKQLFPQVEIDPIPNLDAAPVFRVLNPDPIAMAEFINNPNGDAMNIEPNMGMERDRMMIVDFYFDGQPPTSVRLFKTEPEIREILQSMYPDLMKIED